MRRLFVLSLNCYPDPRLPPIVVIPNFRQRCIRRLVYSLCGTHLLLQKLCRRAEPHMIRNTPTNPMYKSLEMTAPTQATRPARIQRNPLSKYLPAYRRNRTDFEDRDADGRPQAGQSGTLSDALFSQSGWPINVMIT